MANAAKKAQVERAKHMAEDPERAQRLKARDEIGAARNRRITEREATRRAAREQEAAELAARQAAEAAAREAERKAREEAQARRSAEQTAREAAEAAERESDSRGPPSGPEKEEAHRALNRESEERLRAIHGCSAQAPRIRRARSRDAAETGKLIRDKHQPLSESASRTMPH